jgi:hypothetical protein
MLLILTCCRNRKVIISRTADSRPILGELRKILLAAAVMLGLAGSFCSAPGTRTLTTIPRRRPRQSSTPTPTQTATPVLSLSTLSFRSTDPQSPRFPGPRSPAVKTGSARFLPCRSPRLAPALSSSTLAFFLVFPTSLRFLALTSARFNVLIFSLPAALPYLYLSLSPGPRPRLTP